MESLGDQTTWNYSRVGATMEMKKMRTTSQTQNNRSGETVGTIAPLMWSQEWRRLHRSSDCKGDRTLSQGHPWTQSQGKVYWMHLKLWKTVIATSIQRTMEHWMYPSAIGEVIRSMTWVWIRRSSSKTTSSKLLNLSTNSPRKKMFLQVPPNWSTQLCRKQISPKTFLPLPLTSETRRKSFPRLKDRVWLWLVKNSSLIIKLKQLRTYFASLPPSTLTPLLDQLIKTMGLSTNSPKIQSREPLIRNLLQENTLYSFLNRIYSTRRAMKEVWK